MPRASSVTQPIEPSEEKPVIVFEDVSKTFQIKHARSFKQAFIAAIKRKDLSTDFHAVDHVGFEVAEGESVALMGRNGSGKSTTLKLLSGVMEPDTGWIRTRGRIAGLLEVGAGFHPDLTGRQNVYLNAAILGMTKEETDARFEQILEFSEIGEFIDTEVKRYSSGMYSRLGFSVAVHTELDTLLVDEILSVGDAQFRLKCEQKMLELQELGKTMFIVSHNANQMKKLCQRGIVLEHGKVMFDGPIDDAVAIIKPETKPKAASKTQIKSEIVKPTIKITEPILSVYDEVKEKFGHPVQEQSDVPINGGGFSQLFESGIITVSNSSGVGVSLGKGPFLSAYLANGGAFGPWGFLIGDLTKHKSETGTELKQTFQFQHGTANYTVKKGVIFESHDES